ncbi:MAG: hypothetical protein MR601_00425 [Erysipelotrichaceae bacterium]|nr:hypothetical protein [Erysipelotrichaceae bacterium]
MKKIVLFSGLSSVGKTSVLNWIIPFLIKKRYIPAVCKIDCIEDSDKNIFKKFNIPVSSGISEDICPDHFLVSNLFELWTWAIKHNSDYLLIETAGLCNRCSPATKNTLAGCILDASSTTKSPSQLGPMVLQADFIVLTKIDMISQAEKEIIIWKIKQINSHAKIFPVDAVAGYGVDSIANYIISKEDTTTYDNDVLRHTMPSAVCSYCIGEKRVGCAFQQGIVKKIDFMEEI